jgi:hypothetical protein
MLLNRRAAQFVNFRNWAGHRRRPAALVVATITHSNDQNLQRKAYEDLRFRMTRLVFQLPQGASRLPEEATSFIGFERVVLHCRRALELAGSPDPGAPSATGAALTNAGSPPRPPQLSGGRDVTNASAAHKDLSAAHGIATTRPRNSHFKKVSLLSGDVSSGDNRGSLILINPTPAVS